MTATSAPNPFDLAKTQIIVQLFETPREKRDEAWSTKFLEAIPRASMMSFNPQVIQGPDGFPYFRMSLPDAGKFEPFSVMHLLPHCCDQGVGVVIFENSSCSGEPAWVFSLGDLSSYRQFGSFNGDPIDLKDRGESAGGLVVEKLEEGREVLMGAPSEDFLPSWSRKILGAFMNQVYKVQLPKAAVMMDPKLKPSRTLVLSLAASHFKTDEERKNFLRAASWFLPRGRGIALRPESFQEGSAFIDLA